MHAALANLVSAQNTVYFDGDGRELELLRNILFRRMLHPKQKVALGFLWTNEL